jgi:hypothetical protein
MNFVWDYLYACGSGKLGLNDCGPCWQLLVMGVFLLLAVALLVIVRLRPKAQSTGS